MVHLQPEPSETALPPSPITHDANGVPVLPETQQDWREWVSASRTRNFAIGDPLLDWFREYGEDQGFEPDDASTAYNPQTEFGLFIMGKGNEFEAALVDHLATLTEIREIHTLADVRSQDLGAAFATLGAMREGVPVIYQGVLREPGSRTYGSPDLLVRSDELHRLFPSALTAEAASVDAPGLGSQPWHYRVLDIKFSTLRFLAGGGIGNSGSAPAYKIQVYIYNRALGRLQEYEPDTAFLLGRGWRQRARGNDTSSENAMDRLGPVAMTPQLGSEADLAGDWVRRLRRDGRGWALLPQPTVPELWPNMKETADFPWRGAKQWLANELNDLTLLWQVGREKRDKAHEAGITRWTDPRVTPESVGASDGTTKSTLERILAVNHRTDNRLIAPEKIETANEKWRRRSGVEFYVDFETVSNLNDDFSLMPEQNGQPLIFMIGCGHEDNGQWVFRSFCTDTLTETAEAGIIDAWLLHMRDVATSRGPGVEGKIVHYSFAEPANYEEAYDAARNRHPDADWPSLNWFDLWKRIIREEPVVVRGSLSFGLKSVARAMHSHGLIETSWGDSKVDGLGAMVGAWACDAEARETGLRSMLDVPLMQEIAAYNEVDCRVIWEIIEYLRTNH